MVLEKGGPNVDFGIEITYTNNKKRKKWYGSDSLKRDSAHNLYAKRDNVMFVQDIKRNK